MDKPYPIRAALTDRSLYLDTLKLGLPIAGQSLIAVGMNIADTVMLGKMGDAQISAASMAGQYVTLFLACVMGLGMGVTVLTNRYWGMGEREDLHRSVTVMLRWELLLAAIFAVIGLVFPRYVMGIFTKDPETVAYGVRYLRWLAPCYVCIAISQGCTLVLRSAGKLLVPLLSAGAALGINLLLNVLLIEGRLGFPRLEIAGAAIATSVGWGFQFLTTCGYFFFWEKDIGYRLHELRRDCREIMPEYLRISLPVLISDGLLGLGSSVISMVMGHMGPTFAAANSVTIVVIQLSTVLHHGTAGAAGIITGHTMGRGEFEKAEARGYAFVVIALAVGMAAALAIALVREPVLRYYHVSGEAKELAWKLMKVIPVFVVVQSVNGVLTKGVLRGGGDTRFLMVADILFLWTVSIPLGLLGTFVLRWPAVAVYEVMKLDQLLKCGWCLWRLRSGRWRKNI
ncbi:MAG: MATE family efflux transporter [Oscillospiraceae bacterium]|nr:MATE family efflux transporter [Oscillospiraceae bacterium]